MTIQGAIVELQNLLEVDDIPFYYKGGIEKVIETIQMESSRQTWILCSERLPSEDEEVLVCDKDGTMEVCALEMFGRGVGLKWADKNGYECWLDVIAWMPLPKPYEECKESE